MHALRCMLEGQAPDWSCDTPRKHHGLRTIGCSWRHANPGLVRVPAMVNLPLAYLGHVQKGFRPQGLKAGTSDLCHNKYRLYRSDLLVQLKST